MNFATEAMLTTPVTMTWLVQMHQIHCIEVSIFLVT